jgi:hypothetical protein
MPKLKSPETFVTNEVLTAADLQNHVDGAFPVPGFISEQTTVDAMSTADQFIINDISTSALRKVTFGNMLASNLPITASTVTSGVYNAPATRDVVIGPIDGANVTGRVFTSTNGVLVTVDHVAHGLVTGQNVTVTASVPAYSGFYTITVNSVDAFTYSIVPTTPATPPASGTCSYRKEGTVLVNGNISTIENLNANGSLSVGGTFRLNGAGYIGGNLQLPAVVTFAQPPVLVNSQIKPRFDYFIQTRTPSTYTSGWGGIQNLVNKYGTKLTPLDITFTPKKAGNTIVLNWTVFGEAWNSAADIVFLVTRTPNSGVGAGVPVHLPNSVDDVNNTWSGITTGGYDNNDATTPSTINIKIVDLDSLDVSTTYSVYFRAANNRTTSWHLNRSINSAGALDHETGMSLGHAQEIYV